MATVAASSTVTANAARTHTPLSLREKFGYGSGDFAANLFLQMFGFFLLYYYTDVYGISPAAVGLMMLISKVLDAISDPAMGLIADRTRSRWGRYRPYLLWGSVPLGIGGFLVFAGPDLSNTGKLIWAYVTFILVRQLFTLVNVPYSSLMGVIHPLSSERVKATVWRFGLSSVAALFVGITGLALVRELGGGSELVGFRSAMAIMAALATAITLFCFATTKERIEPKPQTGAIRKDIGQVLKTRWWVVIALATILLMAGLMTRAGTALYFFKYVLEVSNEPVFLILDLQSLFLTTGALAQICGVIAGGYLARRFDKGRLVMIAAFVMAISMAGFELLGKQDYAEMMVLQCIAAAAYGVCITMIFAMFTDLAEFIEWRSKRQVTALVISASIFGLKIGNSLAVAIPGFILDATGFVANQAQTAEALDGIMLVFQWIPIACMIGVGLLMLFYGLDRAKVAEVEEELSARRAGSDA